MKAWPRKDFPISVAAVGDDYDVELRHCFVDMYFIRLNEEVLLEIIPSVDLRAPWPPVLGDVDSPVSSDEARRSAVWFAGRAITPDASRAGGIDRSLASDGSIFFVSPSEFEALRAECEALDMAESCPLLSELGDSALAVFLRERFLPSGLLSEHARWLLGGGSDR